MTVYALKPRFQNLLRPSAAALWRLGVTANQVTVSAAVGSIAVAGATAWRAETRTVFLIVPLWMLARMALNAIDGMLAREFRQKSVLGGYLNEIGDVVSDAALYAPFALVPPFGAASVGFIIAASITSELAGALGPMMGASRRYDGPMGKSDRAAVFGTLGIWIGLSARSPDWLAWAMPLLAVLIVITVVNRVRGGVSEARRNAVAEC